MALITLPSLPAGHVVTAAEMATLMSAIMYARDPGATLVRRSTGKTITTTTFTDIDFDTEAGDNDAQFAPTSATITLANSGWYLITGGGVWDANATGTRSVFLLRAGFQMATDEKFANTGASNSTAHACAVIVTANAGDTVGLNVFQSSGANRTFSSAHLSVVRVSGPRV